MGLAIEGNNIGIYKACIKDTDSFKDLLNRIRSMRTLFILYSTKASIYT